MTIFTISILVLAGVFAALLALTQWQTRRIEALYPPRGEFVDVAGGRLHFTQRRPEGIARVQVVLIHGASGSEADMLEPLGDLLAARGLHVFSFDRPGHGYSDRLGAENPAQQAALIRRAMRSLGVERAIIAGHSLGGVVASNFAIEHMDITAGLVLIAPVTHPWPGGAISWYYKPAAAPVIGPAFAHLLAMPAGLALMQRTLGAVFHPQSPPENYVRRTGAERVLRAQNFAANARDVAGTFEFVTRQAPRMRDITAPTAIITGDADTIVLTHIHSFGSAREVPGATLTVLPGVGHSPHWVDPMAVAEAIGRVALRIAPRP